MLGRLINNSQLLMHVRLHNNNVILHPFKYWRIFQSHSKLHESFNGSKILSFDTSSTIKPCIESVSQLMYDSIPSNTYPLHFRKYYKYTPLLYSTFRFSTLHVKNKRRKNVSLISLSVLAVTICALLLTRQ